MGGHFIALKAAAVIVIVGGRPRAPARLGGDRGVGVAVAVGGQAALVSSLARGVVAIVTVGLGSSMGRESAPQLAGVGGRLVAVGIRAAAVWQRRLWSASGAGAGFAAIYNVPLGGALFALEVLLGTVSLPFVLPALVTSVVSTAVAWVALGTRPTYNLPHYVLHPGQQMVFASAGRSDHRRSRRSAGCGR